MSDRPGSYSRLAQLFHWVVAGLLLFQVPLAWTMTAMPLGPDKLASYALHKSLGIVVLGLTALRLAWRQVRRPPPAVVGEPPWRRRAAAGTHALLYGLCCAMPLTGLLGSSAANFPVSLFGLVTLPNLVAPDRALHEALQAAHEALAIVLIALVALHAAAALHHQFVLRDGLLARMLPLGGGSRDGPR